MSMSFKAALQRLSKREPDAADAIEEFIDGVSQHRDRLRATVERQEREIENLRGLLTRIEMNGCAPQYLHDAIRRAIAQADGEDE